MENRETVAGAPGAGVGGIFLGILIGAVIGGVAALLFAPQTGSDTRGMIRDRYGQMKDVFRGTAKEVAATGKKTAEHAKRIVKE